LRVKDSLGGGQYGRLGGGEVGSCEGKKVTSGAKYKYGHKSRGCGKLIVSKLYLWQRYLIGVFEM
jgi:hypothetical protein